MQIIPNFKIDKYFIINALIIVWIVFSVIYVIVDQINDFKQGIVARSYEQGKVDAGKAIVNQASDCKPFVITVDDQRVELLSTRCIQSPTTSAVGEIKPSIETVE